MATRSSCFYTVSSPVMSCSLRGAMSLTWLWTHTHIQTHTHSVFSMVASLSFHAPLNISVSRFTSYCSGKIRDWVGKAEITIDVDWHGRVSII